MLNVVGLFGTCGNSQWREEIAIPMLEDAGINYFNPVVDNWNEEAMENEAKHMAEDQVLLIVITGETTGITSMVETGWMALMTTLQNRNLVVVLENVNDLNITKDNLGNDLCINKTRDLIRKYYGKVKNVGDVPVFLYSDIETGVSKAIELMQEK